jgi:DnaJ-class molecular chaperone
MQRPLRSARLGTHNKSEDCTVCIKDDRGRATGYWSAKQEERKCRKCKGKGRYRKRRCATCAGTGTYYWRSPLKTCAACKGTGRKREKREKKPEMTAIAYAFAQVEKKALT